MSQQTIPVPLYKREFTLDDSPVDIYNFLEQNCDGDPQAYKVLHSEVMDLAPNFTMHFGGGAVPTRALRRIK